MGSIQQGKWAYLILTDQNPLENLKSMKDPEWVMIKGQVLDRNTLKNFKSKAYDRKNMAASALYWIENLWIER